MKLGWTLACFGLWNLLTVGCGSAYLDSVAKYAGTASDGATSLGVVPGGLGGLCRSRATARYVVRRLEAPDAMTGQAWASYYGSSKEADGQRSWNAYCRDVQASSETFSKLLELLAGYGKALQALAQKGVWDGTPLEDLTKNLAEAAGSESSMGKALSGLAPSAQKLGAFVVARYTERKAREFAVSADQPVEDILDGLATYIEAVKVDLVAPTARERVEVLRLLEAKTGVWMTPDAARVISFVDYAQAADEAASKVDATLQSSKELVAKLKAGQHELATAPPEKQSAEQILLAATNILTAINKVRAASGSEPKN